jgi:hypothetical protein
MDNKTVSNCFKYNGAITGGKVSSVMRDLLCKASVCGTLGSVETIPERFGLGNSPISLPKWSNSALM